MWSHAKQRGARGLTAGEGRGTTRPHPEPRSVPASHCFHRLQDWRAELGRLACQPAFLEDGVRREGPSHSPDSPAHGRLSPRSAGDT